MNQILIIFESKYGTTKRYAEWIATALSGTLLERKAVHLKDLEAADTIIYGGIDYTRLNLVHKSMMSMLHKMLLKKADADLTVEDRLMLETYGKTLDFTKQESIQPLVDYVRSL